MILIGTAGSDGLGYEKGIQRLVELGLDAMEIEFTYGVRMTNEKADSIGKHAKENGIRLSIHAPFYINLASPEDEKIEASMKRILDSCERGHHLGAKDIVFHAGFYQKRDPDIIYGMIRDKIIELTKIIRKRGWNVRLSPETTGKPSQFGDLDELLRLRADTNCHICVDFAHLMARNKGVIDYDEVFERIADIDDLHAHFSGIEYSDKGERRHILTTEEVLMPLLKKAVEYNVSMTIINESPDPFNDAALTAKLLRTLV